MNTLALPGNTSVFRSVIVLGRPKFLIIGLLMHGVGAAAAYATTGRFDLPMFLMAQLGVLGLQLMTNYSNEFFDLHVDRLNATFTRWTGGSRVLVEGRVSPKIALRLALWLAACLVGAIAGAWWLRQLLFPRVPPICWGLALIALFLAWGYSAPPLRLSSRGLGETVVALVICLLLPAVGFFAQNGSPNLQVALTLLPLCGIQYTRMIIFNIADARGDEAGGKRTLVVRLGVQRAVGVYLAVQLLSYGMLPVLSLLGAEPKVLLGILCTAPVAALQAWRLRRGAWREPESFNRLTATSTLQFLTAAVAMLLGFAL